MGVLEFIPATRKVMRLLASDPEDFAAERRHSLLELAFSWLAAQPAVASIIAGAVSPEQVRANAIAPTWTLSSRDMQEIDILLAGQPQPSSPPAHPK